VAEHLLNVADVGAAVEKQGGHRVSKSVAGAWPPRGLSNVRADALGQVVWREVVVSRTGSRAVRICWSRDAERLVVLTVPIGFVLDRWDVTDLAV
jgi:hypothetical protein